MKRLFPYHKPFLLAFLVCLSSLWHSPLRAQEAGKPDIQITLNRNVLSPGDTLNVTLVVRGFELKQMNPPTWPEIPGMNLVDSSSSVIPTVIGGRNFARCRFTASYVPSRSGVTTLPAISVRVDGAMFQTKPVRIQVLNSDGSSNAQTIRPEPTAKKAAEGVNHPGLPEGVPALPPGPLKARILASTDLSSVFQGAPVVLTYSLETSGALTGNLVQKIRPDFDGFWAEHTPPSPSERQPLPIANGFRIILDRYVLFPLRSGRLTVAKASWNLVPAQPGVDLLETGTVPLQVRPLPKSPESGRIETGQFTLARDPLPTTLSAGQTFTVHVTACGYGNIRALTAPAFPEGQGFRILANRIVHEDAGLGKDPRNPDPHRFGGKKTWEWVISPAAPGRLILPALQLTVFDPEAELYRTETLPSLSTQVAARAPEESAAHGGITRSGLFMPILGIFTAVALLVLTVLAYPRLRRFNPFARGQSSTSTSGLALLAEAEEMAPHRGADGYYDLLGSALLQDLSQTHGIMAAAMTREELADVLQRKGFEPSDIEGILHVLEQCDEARFARKSFSVAQRVTMLRTVRNVLERPFQPPPASE